MVIIIIIALRPWPATLLKAVGLDLRFPSRTAFPHELHPKRRDFRGLAACRHRREAAMGKLEQLSGVQGHGEKILVVDDESALLRVTGVILRKYGYDVVLAGDGAEAFEIYLRDAQEIALVLTDLQMPRMDGVALSGALRRLNPQVRIIAATGQSKELYLSQLKAVGVDVFLKKPYEIWRLLKAIRELLG